MKQVGTLTRSFNLKANGSKFGALRIRKGLEAFCCNHNKQH